MSEAVDLCWSFRETRRSRVLPATEVVTEHCVAICILFSLCRDIFEGFASVGSSEELDVKSTREMRDMACELINDHTTKLSLQRQ